jgi:hypothetical protein
LHRFVAVPTVVAIMKPGRTLLMIGAAVSVLGVTVTFAKDPNTQFPSDAYVPGEWPDELTGHAPERPVALYAAKGDRMLPVVAMRKQLALVLADGRTVEADKDGGYVLAAGREFSTGLVTLHEPQLGHWDSGREGSRTRSESSMDGWVESDVVLEKCFVVVIVVDERDFLLETKEPGYGAGAVEVGRLEPGKRVKFHIPFPVVAHQQRLRWAIGVFSEGKQVRCVKPLGSLPLLVDRVERYRHSRAVTERLRAKKDAPLLLYRAVPPDLPAEAKQRWTGVTVNIDLEIDATGAVASARVLDADKAELQNALAGALKHWLFLPRISGGVAVGATQRVALPL